MAKFFGVVGYGTQSETSPGSGVWEESITQKPYFGDVIRNTRKMQEGLPIQVNDDITVGNSISIVADAWATNNIFAMRYVEWAGTKWKITDVEVQRPRLILRLGGVWDGPTS